MSDGKKVALRLLKKYGNHYLQNCGLFNTQIDECTCGLDEALRELDAKGDL